ncbi:hypothetical protein ANCCAN_25541 [Ancylostoma caninum]|uniref:Uncharacterized protein n=1 Tax=Ancylostoma caninum TaxID=29170 RepID=A0A368F981_ANCCA|nr:hypothetical protein ANCCAN_25541 [Ancylostoma caninum]
MECYIRWAQMKWNEAVAEILGIEQVRIERSSFSELALRRTDVIDFLSHHLEKCVALKNKCFHMFYIFISTMFLESYMDGSIPAVDLAYPTQHQNLTEFINIERARRRL